MTHLDTHLCIYFENCIIQLTHGDRHTTNTYWIYIREIQAIINIFIMIVSQFSGLLLWFTLTTVSVSDNTTLPAQHQMADRDTGSDLLVDVWSILQLQSQIFPSEARTDHGQSSRAKRRVKVGQYIIEVNIYGKIFKQQPHLDTPQIERCKLPATVGQDRAHH